MLTKEDVKAIYYELYNTGKVDISLAGIELLNKLEEYDFDLNNFETYVRIKEVDIINNYRAQWKDSLITNFEPYFLDFKKVLYCPLEDVPLCVSGKFSEIAKWRLRNAV
jgi:hypothetical protein